MEKIIDQDRVFTRMSVPDFWRIIDSTLTSSSDLDSQIEALKNQLRKLSPRQVVEFDNRFGVFKNKAYRWDLWGAIYLLNGGCSDDSFEYFREWLVGRGRETFERAIKNPESIKDLPIADDQWEGLGSCAAAVYKEKTKKNYIPGDIQVKESPSGEEWEEDKLPEIFPAIWSMLKTKQSK